MTDKSTLQPVLTDDEILAATLYGQSEARMIRNGRAIEQAVLSKLRAPVAEGTERDHSRSRPRAVLSPDSMLVKAHREAERMAGAPVAGEAQRLDAPAQVGGTRFGKGIHWSTVIHAAQRHHEYMQDPAREAARIAQAKQFQALVAGDAPPHAREEQLVIKQCILHGPAPEGFADWYQWLEAPVKMGAFIRAATADDWKWPEDAQDLEAALGAALCRANSAEAMWHKCRDELKVATALLQSQASEAVRDAGMPASVAQLVAAAKGMTKLYPHVWDRPDGGLVVFPENVARFDAAFDALRIAVGEAVEDDDGADGDARDERKGFETVRDGDHPVFAFLLGEGLLHGVEFGKRAPGAVGKWWWRKDLRAALSAQPAAEPLSNPKQFALTGAESIRSGAPYDDPAFEALCREHGIWGTAEAALCAVFWRHACKQRADATDWSAIAAEAQVERDAARAERDALIVESQQRAAGTDERTAFEATYQADYDDPGAACEREHFGKGYRAGMAAQSAKEQNDAN